MATRMVLIVGILGLLLLVCQVGEEGVVRELESAVGFAKGESPAAELVSWPGLEPPTVAPETRSPVASPAFSSDDPEEEPPASLDHGDLLVRFVATGPAPEIDLQEWVVVELWDVEPKHVFDTTRDTWWDPEPFESYGDATEHGLLFEEVPRHRRLWISAECRCWEGEVVGCAPTFAPVPPPPAQGEEWVLELPVRVAGWVHGRVAGVGEETDWELVCEESGEELEGCGEEAFRFWPVPAGPVTVTLTATEEGRAVRRRHRSTAPTSGGADVGELSFSRGANRLIGSVRLEDGTEIEATIDVRTISGSTFQLDTDSRGRFTIEGDLDDLASLRVRSADLHEYEAVSVDLSSPPPQSVELVMRRRSARLIDVIIDPELSNGEDLEGDLVMVLDSGLERFARYGPNHSGYCGSGIFFMQLIPPGETRYVAWIPEKGLSGTGVLTVQVPPGDRPVPGRFFDGHPILHPVLRKSETAVSGGLVVLPGTNPPGYCEGVEPIVIICGDPRTAPEYKSSRYPYQWIEPGRFSLKGLPADCHIRLVFKNQPDEVLFETDLRLDRHEHVELGTVTVGRR